MSKNLTDLFERIREKIDECGATANRNDHALVAITLSIGAGINTKNDLIRLLVKFGFKGGHIYHVLDDRTGPFRNSDYWWVDADGRYHLPGDAD